MALGTGMNFIQMSVRCLHTSWESGFIVLTLPSTFDRGFSLQEVEVRVILKSRIVGGLPSHWKWGFFSLQSVVLLFIFSSLGAQNILIIPSGSRLHVTPAV